MVAASKSAELRIPANLAARLEELSQKTGRSRTYHVRKALERYIEDMEDLLLSKAALKESRGKPTTSLEDVIKELGLEREV